MIAIFLYLAFYTGRHKIFVFLHIEFVTMPSYKLLRSNRESGPYSLNDLVTLGLKPYDLIWVDGRSAAWRYPSEVTELKDFAPAVEEQPYDRFYKKSSESEKP